MNSPVSVLSSVILGGLLILASLSDLRTLRIPNTLTFSLVASGLLQGAFYSDQFTARLIGAALGYGILALVGEAYFRLNGREGLGLGDAKLFAGAGAWLGWQALPPVLLIASIGGLLFALAGRTGEREPIPFAPFISLATFAIWAGTSLSPN